MDVNPSNEIASRPRSFRVDSKRADPSQVQPPVSGGEALRQFSAAPAMPEDAVRSPSYLVQHNLSLQSLLFAREIGGLACPSMALVRADNPLLDFGEISLVAKPGLVSPGSDCAIYSGDAYVKRSPEPWGKVNKAAGLAVAARAAEHLKSLGLAHWDDFDTQLFYRKERLINARDRVTSVLRRSMGLSLEFLGRHGVDVLVRTKADPVSDLILDEARALNGGAEFLPNDAELVLRAMSDESVLAKVVNLIDEAVNQGARQILDAQTLQACARDTIKKAVARGSRVPLYDKQATSRAIDDFFLHNQEFEKQRSLEIGEMVRTIVPSEEIRSGQRFVSLSLATLVKHLRSNSVGTEESSSVSVGRLKSRAIRRIHSPGQLAGAMNLIGDAQTVATEDQRLESLTRKFVAKMFDYGFGSKAGDDYYSPLGIFLPYLASTGDALPEPAAVKATLEQCGLRFPGDQLDELENMIGLFREIVQEVRLARVAYFEAKMQRAVDLSEFQAAVVPASLPDDVLKYLKTKVAHVSTYTPGNQQERQMVLSSVASSSEVALSSAPKYKGASL